MSKIHSKGTKIEKVVFRELRKRNIYFQRHYKSNICNIDIALPRKKKAIFLDGDFWHGYGFTKLKLRLPKKFWLDKIMNNMKRDRRYRRQLREEGWDVLRIWEHELNKNLTCSIDVIIDHLND